MAGKYHTFLAVKGINKPRVLNKEGLRHYWLAALGLAGFIFVAFYNLEYSPVIWFDEGEHLRVPKTLINFGQYATWSAEGFRYFGPTIGVGPTVMLPVAFSFSLLGTGLWQARLVIALYLVAAAALYWILCRQSGYSKMLAGLTLLFLAVAPGVDFITLGRQGLGEVPALAFCLAGMLAWQRAQTGGNYHKAWLLMAGQLWALAAITKSNYGLLLPVVLALTWLVYRFYYRQAGLGWPALLVPGTIIIVEMAGWYALVLLFLGSNNPSNNFELLRTASGGSAFVFSPARMAGAIKFLFSPGLMFGLTVPALLYGLYLVFAPRRQNKQLALPLIFCLVWLGWFGFASIGWPRYAFPGLVVASLFVVRLVADIPELAARLFRQPGQPTILRRATLLLVAGSILWSSVIIGLETLKKDPTPQQFAAYLNQHISRTAIIETWEAELGFLTDHTYHYPPPQLLDKAVRRKWLDQPVAPLDQLYHAEELEPDYLIDGTFSRWNALYPPALLDRRYRLVVQFGSYSLYQRVS